MVQIQAVIGQETAFDDKDAMRFEAFLSPADAQRAERVLASLRRHDITSLAFTGGMAVELHLELQGGTAEARPLNDIDFLVDSFSEIPDTLSADFLFGHVHPNDPPARTLLQCVEPNTGVRVDIFRACGNELARAEEIDLDSETMRIVSLEDLVARMARLCLDLAAGVSIPRKHPRDFLRLLPFAVLEGVELVWPEHRKLNHPVSFAEVAPLLCDLIASRQDLQIDPAYSRDTKAICPRRESTLAFPLARPDRILSLLGYC